MSWLDGLMLLGAFGGGMWIGVRLFPYRCLHEWINYGTIRRCVHCEKIEAYDRVA